MEPHDQSHVVGPRDVPLLDVSIGQALSDAARRWPDSARR